MSRTGYSFAGSFVVPAPRERVHAVLLDLEHYPDWWPQVRAVASLGPDDALVVCRSRLPYDLDLVLHAVDRSRERLEVSVDGPFTGWVRWHLADVRPAGARTLVCWEQQVRVRAAALVVASYLARPALRWNHARMMAGAVAGLAGRVQETAATAAS